MNSTPPAPEPNKENINPNISTNDTGSGYLPDRPMSSPINVGGRRHKGSKKMHKGKRHGNASLRAWVTFVKKVQKEEGVSYKEAMSVAKKRKDSGEKWRGGDGDGEVEEEDCTQFEDGTYEYQACLDRKMPMGGRRRSKKHRGSKRRCGSKKRRHTRRH